MIATQTHSVLRLNCRSTWKIEMEYRTFWGGIEPALIHTYILISGQKTAMPGYLVHKASLFTQLQFLWASTEYIIDCQISLWKINKAKPTAVSVVNWQRGEWVVWQGDMYPYNVYTNRNKWLHRAIGIVKQKKYLVVMLSIRSYRRELTFLRLSIGDLQCEAIWLSKLWLGEYGTYQILEGYR